jgi:hypothetical protein
MSFGRPLSWASRGEGGSFAWWPCSELFLVFFIRWKSLKYKKNVNFVTDEAACRWVVRWWVLCVFSGWSPGSTLAGEKRVTNLQIEG